MTSITHGEGVYRRPLWPAVLQMASTKLDNSAVAPVDKSFVVVDKPLQRVSINQEDVDLVVGELLTSLLFSPLSSLFVGNPFY